MILSYTFILFSVFNVFSNLARFFLVTHFNQKLPLSGYYICDVEADYLFGDYKSEGIGRAEQLINESFSKQLPSFINFWFEEK